MKRFPKLYKRTSTDKLQEWTIVVDGANYWTEFGQTGGTITRSEPTRCKGKNAGKANATSDFEQALLEVESLWRRKLEKDYTQDPNVKAGQTSELIVGGLLPLLAHKYQDHAAKVVWPAYCQRKLDGVRCIAMVDDEGKCTLWSRTRKPILSMPHIIEAVEAQTGPNTILDGELFSPDFHSRFEELMSLIRAQYAKDNCTDVQYWVYDAIVDGVPFEARKELIADLSEPLVSVETVLAQNESEMRALFGQYIEEGFEGLMLRSRKGLYVGKRSVDLLKVKERDDSEFRVVGVEEGKGKLEGHGILVLQTDLGKQFKAKMRGPIEALVEIWKNRKAYVGRTVTVAYQGLTADGIPRFPVALRFRGTGEI